MKCPNSEFFWSVFSRIRTEYGEIRISPYSVRLRENADLSNSEYGHFSRSDPLKWQGKLLKNKIFSDEHVFEKINPKESKV